jgi:hypothetical protein
VRLERVVEDALGSILSFHDDVGLAEPPRDVATRVVPRFADEGAAADGFLGIEQRLEPLPLGSEGCERVLGLPEGVGGDSGDRLPVVVRRLGEDFQVAGADDAADARRSASGVEIDPDQARPCVRATENGGVEHPWELNVGRVLHLAAGSSTAVHPFCRPPDGLQRACRPGLERVLFDHDPLLGEPALDFLLGADQPRQAWIASSILG